MSKVGLYFFFLLVLSSFVFSFGFDSSNSLFGLDIIDHDTTSQSIFSSTGNTTIYNITNNITTYVNTTVYVNYTNNITNLIENYYYYNITNNITNNYNYTNNITNNITTYVNITNNITNYYNITNNYTTIYNDSWINSTVDLKIFNFNISIWAYFVSWLSSIGNWTNDRVNYNTTTQNQNIFLNLSGSNANQDINIGQYNITAKDIIASQYLVGQPLTGMLGSGIISVNEENRLTEVNITCSGLTCTYPQFVVRLASITSSGMAKYCNISAGSTTVADNSQSVLYLDNNCAIQNTEIDNFFNNVITQGGVWDFANVVAYNGQSELINGISLEQRRMMKQRVINFNKNHLSIVSGFSRTVGTFPAFNISAGKFIYLMDVVSTSQITAGAVNSVELIYHNGTSTSWRTEDVNNMNWTYCDNGTARVACSEPNKYRRVWFFDVGYNDTTDNTGLHELLPLNSIYYSSLSSCLDTTTNPLTYTLPSWYTYSAVPLYAYCTQASSSSWDGAWIDLRTVKTSVGATGGIDTSLFVPYIGATSNINIGNYNVSANSFIGDLYGSWNGSSQYYPLSNPYSFLNTSYSDGWINSTMDSKDTAVNNSWKLNVSQTYYPLSNPYGFTNISGGDFNNNINQNISLVSQNDSSRGNWTADKPYYIDQNNFTNWVNRSGLIINWSGTSGSGYDFTNAINLNISNVTNWINGNISNVTRWINLNISNVTRWINLNISNSTGMMNGNISQVSINISSIKSSYWNTSNNLNLTTKNITTSYSNTSIDVYNSSCIIIRAYLTSLRIGACP